MVILAWSLASVIVGADALVLDWLPISFKGLGSVIVCVLLLIGAALALGERLPRIALLANCAALWCVMLVAGPILTYCAATVAAPLRDAEFVRLDAVLGFDWSAHAVWIAGHPLLGEALLVAYRTLLFQGLLAMVYLPLCGRETQFFETYSATVLSIMLTAAGSAVLPARGPVSYFFPDLASTVPHLPHLFALRSGQPTVFELSSLTGIVNFPSFHCAAGLLNIWGFRRCGLASWLVAALNGVMLVSIPAIGTHYLVDLLGGAAVAAASLAGALVARRAAAPAARYLSRSSAIVSSAALLPESRS
ncbi:MAG TPA: phosphatase PAP2 family protein [Stellaceae bacterium]|nr:phosphatase PAP2 family protein [Stellaceae bacterium]